MTLCTVASWSCLQKKKNKTKKNSLALSLTCCLVESITENGVLLLETSQLGIRAFFQLVLQAENL